jgi:hypothetical protein
MSAVKSVKDFSEAELQAVLLNWDVKAEQDKADFIEALYQFYLPSNHSYTGLYQQFAQDLLLSFKSMILSGEFKLKPASAEDDSTKIDNSNAPLCDI